jgi:ATP-dependent DNA ligase
LSCRVAIFEINPSCNVQRRARLQALLARAKNDLLRFSESFPDADRLLAECSRRGLEGIVAKRKDAP